MGKKALIQHYHREDFPYEVVETGQVLDLGKKKGELSRNPDAPLARQYDVLFPG